MVSHILLYSVFRKDQPSILHFLKVSYSKVALGLSDLVSNEGRVGVWCAKRMRTSCVLRRCNDLGQTYMQNFANADFSQGHKPSHSPTMESFYIPNPSHRGITVYRYTQ